MNNLEISESKANQLDELEAMSIKTLKEYIGGNRQGGDDIRIAAQMMQVVAKNRQTTTAREALRFNMITSITDDPKTLTKYAKATQPQIGKLLPGNK